jgi:hypothetical protein
VTFSFKEIINSVKPMGKGKETLPYTNLHFDGLSAAKIPIADVKAKIPPHQIPVPMYEILSSLPLPMSNT